MHERASGTAGGPLEATLAPVCIRPCCCIMVADVKWFRSAPGGCRDPRANGIGSVAPRAQAHTSGAWGPWGRECCA